MFEYFFANVRHFLDQCELFLRLRIFTTRTFHTPFGLASEEEYVQVFSSLINTPKTELRERTFQIERAPGRWEHATGARRIGDAIGTKLRIVYFDGPRPRFVYVEHVAARAVLFKVPIGVVEGFANDAVFDLVFEFNKHLLTLIPAFVELLMYLYGILQHGFIGLVEMLLYPLAERAVEDILDELGFDPAKAGLWVGGLALLAHRFTPRLGRQPVLGLEELGISEARSAGVAAGAEARALGGDMARAENRGLLAAPGATGTEMTARASRRRLAVGKKTAANTTRPKPNTNAPTST